MWCRIARRFAKELRHVGHLTNSSGDVAVSVGSAVAVPSELSAVVIGGAGDGDGWGEAGRSGAPTSASEAHGLKIRSVSIGEGWKGSCRMGAARGGSMRGASWVCTIRAGGVGVGRGMPVFRITSKSDTAAPKPDEGSDASRSSPDSLSSLFPPAPLLKLLNAWEWAWGGQGGPRHGAVVGLQRPHCCQPHLRPAPLRLRSLSLLQQTPLPQLWPLPSLLAVLKPCP
ncbi:unnamed protein product [Closterium sp. NIES-65]|nr:unnamed protein product [Closterium sp. NIES-65]